MNVKVKLPKKPTSDPRVDAIIKLAILAVGGQGGGVLSNWIVDLAERNNYHVQSTSIAGVAQRTGATIYYVEMLPKSDQQPVFSLNPSPGDVDIVIAAELMEAGRAIMRGFVTPDRTTLLTSTHRAFATAEKIAPGNAIADDSLVLDHARKSCVRLLAFDMESIASEAGTVVSASLFGALAGSGTLPFSKDSYEETIKASGRGVEQSLAAFRLSALAAKNNAETATDKPAPISDRRKNSPDGSPKLLAGWEKLCARIHAMPPQVQSMTKAGLQKVVDFQDLDYGEEYLKRIEQILLLDNKADEPKKDFTLSRTAAKYIANAMAYDDIIRVADIKTRRTRFDEIHNQVGYDENNALRITEYFHPGGKEFCSLMPAGIGQYIETRPGLFKKIDWLVNRGRRIRTDRLSGFFTLYLLGGLRKYRRKLLRHKIEQQHIELWTEAAISAMDDNYDLAVEILKCQRLIKGYSDTHKRGLSKFGKVLAGIKLVENRHDAADWARRLLDTALDDVDGQKLDGTLKTIRSFEEAAP